MEKLTIEATRLTPLVDFDPSNGHLLLEGKSSPDNSLDFYSPIINYVDGIDSSMDIHVSFKIDYFNTSSTKCIMMLFKSLAQLKEQGCGITVDWHAHEDDYDLVETGEDFEDICDLEFNFVLR